MTRFTFHVSRFPLPALLLITLLAAALRFHRIADAPFDLDEQYSLEISASRGYADARQPAGVFWPTPPDFTSLRGAPPAWRIWPNQRDDAHPPLYFLALRGWRAAFGDSPLAVRSLTAVASAAAVPLLYLVVRELAASPAPALWAAFILAVAGPQIVEAQDARPYALATLLLAAAALAAVRLVHRGWSAPRGVAFAAAALLALLTNHTTLPPLAAFLAYVTLRAPAPVRRRTWAAFGVAAAVYLLTWGPFLPAQVRYVARFLPSTPAPAPRLLFAAAITPVLWLAEPLTRPPGLAVAAVAFALPVLLLRRNRALLLPALWMTSSVAVVLAGDLLTRRAHVTTYRYTFLAAPGFYAAMALLLARARLRPLRAVPAAAAALYCAVTLPQAYDLPVGYYRPHEHWRQFAQEIAAKSDPRRDAVVYACTGRMDWDGAAASLYLCTQGYAPLPPAGAVLDAPATPDLLRALDRYDAVWLVTGWSYPPPERLLPGYTVTDRIFDPEIRGGASKMVRTRGAPATLATTSPKAK